MDESVSISRRNLLKLGAGVAVTGGGILAPTLSRADESGPVRSTVRQGAFPILMGDTTAGVAPIGYGPYEGGQVFLKPVPDSRRGSMSRVNLVSAGANKGVRADWTATPVTLTDSDTFEFWAYLESPNSWPNPEPTTGAPGAIYLSDASVANYFTAFFTLRRGWNFVRLGRDRFSAVGNPSWSDTFPLMRIAMPPCTAGPISAFFGEFRKNGKDRPLVCLMFDDGEESVRLNAQPILQSYNIPSTIAVISGVAGMQLGHRTFSSMEQLATNPAGTAFVNHTATHQRGWLNNDRVPYNVVYEEVKRCQVACQDLPGFAAYCFAAPYGEWSNRYLTVLRDCGIKYSRCLVSGYGKGYRRYTGSRLDNPLLLCSLVVSPQTSPQELLDYIDLGIASCQSMIIVFHDIRPTATAPTDYALSDFQTFVEGLPARSADADFVTFPQFCARLETNGLV